MIFSTLLFLLLFLPILFIGIWVINKRFHNVFLLIISLIFYAWGEPILIYVMMGSIFINYIIGRLFESSLNRKLVLYFGVSINLCLLAWFKYMGFFYSTYLYFTSVSNMDTEGVVLPIGISFYTFQSISYLMDVYNNKTKPQKSLINLGLYIALFPQLIAGPIVRYTDIMKELLHRTITIEQIQSGVQKFILGLSKKVIIANPTGQVADLIFNASEHQWNTPLAWCGAIAYSIQIYFDFSGYSDMAIGLGRILGFKFIENFNFPYMATSIQDFWRRWHISLSSWFRDYLYIPLGGNRKGKLRTTLNLALVFILTGLWHGPYWSYIFWGVFHGSFLILERTSFSTFISRYTILSRGYVLLVVIIGWVFFRMEDMERSISFIKTMFIPNFLPSSLLYEPYINITFYIPLILGIVFSSPVLKQFDKVVIQNRWSVQCLYIVSFMWCLVLLASNSYNPFIYFKF